MPHCTNDTPLTASILTFMPQHLTPATWPLSLGYQKLTGLSNSTDLVLLVSTVHICNKLSRRSQKQEKEDNWEVKD